MKLKIGDRVVMKRSYINNWIFSNPNWEASVNPRIGVETESYHNEVMLGILALMLPLEGTIIKINSAYVQVYFVIDDIRDTQWYSQDTLIKSND
jgi:hypothetical protein